MSITVSLNNTGNVNINKGEFSLGGSVISTTEAPSTLTIAPGCNITVPVAISADKLILQSESQDSYSTLTINANASVTAKQSGRQQYTKLKGEGTYYLYYFYPELSSSEGGYYQAKRIEDNTDGVDTTQSNHVRIQDCDVETVAANLININIASQSTAKITFNSIPEYITETNTPAYSILRYNSDESLTGVTQVPTNSALVYDNFTTLSTQATVTDMSFALTGDVRYAVAVNCRGLRNWSSPSSSVPIPSNVIYYYIGDVIGDFTSPGDWSYSFNGTAVDAESISHNESAQFYIGKSCTLTYANNTRPYNLYLTGQADINLVSSDNTPLFLRRLTITDNTVLSSENSVALLDDSVVMTASSSGIAAPTMSISKSANLTNAHGSWVSDVSFNVATNASYILPDVSITSCTLNFSNNSEFLFDKQQTYCTIKYTIEPGTVKGRVNINSDIYVNDNIQLKSTENFEIDIAGEGEVILNSNNNHIVVVD